MTPKIIRMRDAPDYLGMAPKAFNQMVRPYVREIRIGVQGVAFKRDELDQWADEYFDHHGVAKDLGYPHNGSSIGRRHEGKESTWHGNQSPVSMNVMASGTSTNASKVSEFRKVLEKARGKKPRSI